MRTRLLALPAALLGGLLLAPAASATTLADVVSALRTNPVYVDPKATVAVDAAKVGDQLRASDRPIYVAVLPTAAGTANGRAAPPPAPGPRGRPPAAAPPRGASPAAGRDGRAGGRLAGGDLHPGNRAR